MLVTPQRFNPPISSVFPQLGNLSILQQFALAIVGTLFLTISAKVQVPIWPVKVSMQTSALVLIGILYGPRLGIATVFLYMLEGISGFPVFQGTPDRGLGISYMMGPTGGYLLGFFALTYFMGVFFEKGYGSKLTKALPAVFVAFCSLYVPGVAWLSYLIGVEKGLHLGLYVFLPSAFLQMGLCATLWLMFSRKCCKVEN
ncbi:MAG: biotin transporter BioY [Alphaproteobacteria bacterium]|jgi:biotin transport system substrate-specific component|nr:biotin transporter BioY [Alphaproteobacteria bacterium]MBT5389992.1 biotin transporter BioY [Alphaproteobacteria bacterium]